MIAFSCPISIHQRSSFAGVVGHDVQTEPRISLLQICLYLSWFFSPLFLSSSFATFLIASSADLVLQIPSKSKFLAMLEYFKLDINAVQRPCHEKNF